MSLPQIQILTTLLIWKTCSVVQVKHTWAKFLHSFAATAENQFHLHRDKGYHLVFPLQNSPAAFYLFLWRVTTHSTTTNGYKNVESTVFCMLYCLLFHLPVKMFKKSSFLFNIQPPDFKQNLLVIVGQNTVYDWMDLLQYISFKSSYRTKA